MFTNYSKLILVLMLKEVVNILVLGGSTFFFKIAFDLRIRLSLLLMIP